MKTSDFWYDLPDELVAHRPLKKRDSSRLLHLNKKEESVTHRHFSDIVDLLNKGDRLVFNNTRVIPGRLFGLKDTGVRIELLFTKAITDTSWEVIAKPARRLKPGVSFTLEKAPHITLTVESATDKGGRILSCNEPILPLLEEYGEMPIPPYMERRADEADRTNYQTVFADDEKKGAVAAPTAGLHVTDELLAQCKEKGITTSFVTLHVGIGTFRPVKVDNPADHVMHSERYEVSAETADAINATKKAGGRIIAVGTTVVRTLESVAHDGEVVAENGDTEIFIWPGYSFKIVDALITNFHLPESTLLMLVSALYSKKAILDAYKIAVDEKYRFFSYGDAMFIE